jgi:hypothetical protein
VTLAAGTTTRQVIGGDFDGDNDIDLAATSNGTSQVFLYENDGTDAWPRTTQPGVFPGAFAIDAGDLDGDGWLDLAVACQSIDSVAVLINQGDGTFVETGRWKTGDGPWDLRGNDMDGDGDYDLVVVASFGNRLQILRNEGDGTFPTKTGVQPGFFPLAVFAADLDGDGDQDAIASNYNSGNATTWLNDGDANLSADATLTVDRTGSYAWAHDLDGDGDLDVSVVDEIGDWLYVFFNDPAVDAPVLAGAGGPGPRLAARPNPVSAGQGTQLAVSGVGPAAEVRVLDVAGRVVRTLHTGPLPSGGILDWDGRDDAGRAVAAGTYLVRAEGPAGTASAKVQRLR